MWIEGRDQRGPPLGTGTRHRAAYHRLMARMKSVEIAERDDPAPQMSGHRRAAVQPLHRPRYRGVRPSMPAQRQHSAANQRHEAVRRPVTLGIVVLAPRLAPAVDRKSVV